MRLVIVESPKKARTIQGFLGGGYRVSASMGHVRDLPAKALGVEIARDFAPQYEVLPKAQKTLSSLRAAVHGAESVLLATDPDREGEAIAWHLVEALRLPKSRFRRITFHEISRRAIQEALAHPRDLDAHLIDAQQARRVLDRLVGYQLSPLLWRKVQRGTSAGRVQSVAVKLVVDREREIQAFVPVEYWTIDVRLCPLVPDAETRGGGEAERDVGEDRPLDAKSFLARLIEIDGKKAEIPDQATAEALVAQLETAAYTVRETAKKTTTRNPFPPFTTSTLQQAAGNRLRFPAKKTMAAAQSLYEAGLITYMRTDSVAVSSAAIAQAREVITKQFGAAYVPEQPRRYATKTKNAQEAHEAIRPVDIAKTPAALRGSLAGDEWRVYDLIWKRMIASQMASARYLQDVATIDGAAADSHRFTLRAQATTLVFPGWLAAYGEDAQEPRADEDGPANDRLPHLEAGQPLELQDVLPAQHFTQPPRRYTEASLVKALEDAGVGRPSTYAAVVSTIQDRDYVRLEQRHFVPTDLGFAANDFLVAHFPSIVDLPFTAQMEDSLDEIAGGRLQWTQMLHTFYGPFAQTIARAQTAPVAPLKQHEPPAANGAPAAPVGRGVTSRSAAVARGTSGRNGRARRMAVGFAVPSGSDPEASGVTNGWDFQGGEAENLPAAHKGRARRRAAGSGGGQAPALQPRSQPAEAQPSALSPQSSVVCPQCGKPLVERRSQYGPFLGCSGFPACRYIQRDAAGQFFSGSASTSPPATGHRVRQTGRKGRRGRAFSPPSPDTQHVVRRKRSRPQAGVASPATFSDDDLPF